MVAPEPAETISHGEVESALHADQHHNKNHQITSIGRQSSIYSLTLDEFQHTLCESGKNFGSMNMDEFLTSIWNAEENHTADTAALSTNQLPPNLPVNETTVAATMRRSIVKQQSLPRQGSLTLPEPLCRKTVDEVWSEIHREHQGEHQNNSFQNPEAASRQPTFGEMTLEDFLIKAGVVREQNPTPAAQPAAHGHFGLYQSNNNPVMSPNFGAGHVLGLAGVSNSGSAAAPAYQPMPAARGVIGTDQSSVYLGTNEKRNGGYSVAQPPCYGGGYVSAGQPMGVVPSMSPVSSEAVGTNQQVDSPGGQFGMDQMGGIRKKRIIDGPVEKVVERRQRRMIKNRESAARSRARKQAYTVELEAELNQLKEENTHLKQALVEMERKRKEQYVEELKTKAYTKAQKAKEKLRIMRRNLSCPL